jgi:hypothetical protein
MCVSNRRTVGGTKIGGDEDVRRTPKINIVDYYRHVVQRARAVVMTLFIDTALIEGVEGEGGRREL